MTAMVDPLPLRLSRTRLSEMHLQARPDLDSLPAGTEISWAADVRAAYWQSTPQEVELRLEAQLVYAEGSPRPLDLRLTLIGTFWSPHAFRPEEVDATVQARLIQTVWPQLQETLASITSRAGGPVFLLPVPGPAEE